MSEILLNKLLEAGVHTSFVHSSIIISTLCTVSFFIFVLYIMVDAVVVTIALRYYGTAGAA